ncbi:MAG: bifunctional diaminohydroxyphosphoribosylaminopyrimidine deaminase/5-amino-6-(5-phosphoribosylamino)uracil reductase RibD [Phycisphaerae bacterium]|nr:bifunctional diaminohydroxyphosphoribosylaminopyrimidine deaminase/5-amino-6-(5-phosphoribosylamino)uracil reductase RibD [Phycisphaerae bacterium]
MQADIDYMQLALELARRGLGNVEPNPAVGCVIVKNGEIIGQGLHEKFGGPHAEINALSDCQKNGQNPAGATMYVTLEPCSHTRKTPPCTQAVIKAGIKKVIIASKDPTKLASGGIQQLKEAGVKVETGLCREQAEQLNAPFYKHARTGLPWVIVKWAQSIDGKLAWRNPPKTGHWISNEKSRADVHRLRKKVQGILTGIDTVIADNPKLTVRIEGQPIDRPPLRIVLDSKLRMPWDCRLITVPDAPTLIVTTIQTAQAEFQLVEKFKDAGVEVFAVPPKNEHCDLKAVLTELGKRGIQQLLIEAGPRLISQFLAQNLVNEVRIYIAPIILGQNGTADISAPMSAIVSHQKLKNIQIKTFDNDICISGLLEFKL